MRADDPAERDHGHLGRPATDVDDHASTRLGDRQARADRRRHRLLDEVDGASTGGQRRLLDGLSLNFGDPAWDAQDDLRERQSAAATFADEVPQHLLGHLEVGDHPVPERPDRTDRGRRPADHAAGVGSDGLDPAGAVVDGDDGGLEDDDALAANEDERVGGAEIDRKLPPGE